MELSNLQRQIAHATADVGAPKVESASATVRSLNPDTRVEVLNRRLRGGDELAALIAGAYFWRQKVRADALRERLPVETVAFLPDFLEAFWGIRLHVLIRFGMWEEALAEPPAPEGMPMTTFMRDYAQGVALAATGQLDAARENLVRMQAQRDSGELDAVMDRQGDIAHLLSEIAMQLVEAEIARNEGNDGAEIEHLTAAIAAQDALPYTEPPFWHFPIRQALGSAYLRMGKPELAQTAFEEDLVKFPNNGWSLYGLKEALAAQGQPTVELDQAVAAAWQHADIEPTSGP